MTARVVEVIVGAIVDADVHDPATAAGLKARNAAVAMDGSKEVVQQLATANQRLIAAVRAA